MKCLLTGLLLAFTLPVIAQDNSAKPAPPRRSTFIGISIGPSFAVGSFADTKKEAGAGAGAHLNLVNFGHLFSNRIGMATKWYGGSNVIKFQKGNEQEEENYKPWSYGGILVGPMVSIPVSNAIDIDFRPMIGYSGTTLPQHESEKKTVRSELALAYSLGVTAQFHLSSRFGIHTGLDYFHTKANFNDEFYGMNFKFTKKISTLAPTASFVYRFN